MSVAGSERQEWGQLEAQLEDLIGLIQRLKVENQALRLQQEHLVAEHSSLVRHREQARQRIETMISRLRALGDGVARS